MISQYTRKVVANISSTEIKMFLLSELETKLMLMIYYEKGKLYLIHKHWMHRDVRKGQKVLLGKCRTNFEGYKYLS